MDALLRVIREFPALWAFIGLLVGTGISFFVAQKFAPMFGKGLREFSVLHDDMVEAYKAQIAELKNQLVECKKLGLEYRTKLHAERDAHWKTQLKLTEIEAKPNVDRVYESQQKFFSSITLNMTQQTTILQEISKRLNDHDASIESRSALVVDKIIEAVKNGDLKPKA